MSNSDGLAGLGDASIAAMPARPVAPRIRIKKTKTGWEFACPYIEADRERWEAMLCQAFGTRSISVINHFLDTIVALTKDGEWDEINHVWMPLERDFQTAVNIINAMQPQNEAQAAYAAQLVALHLSSVKLGAQTVKSYADPRATAILAKTTRAYGDGLERMARLQGKVQPRQVNQTIQVVYVDNRDQRSVHVNGGSGSNGDQPHRTVGGEAVQSTTVPSQIQTDGQCLQSASCDGEACLPRSWWGSRLWSALRRA